MYQSTIKFYNLEIEKINTTTLGGKLRRARKLYGLTQDSLAKLTGVSAPTIHELEQNKNINCTRATLNKLCRIFPEELVLTDYHKFVLHQEYYLNNIDTNYLSKLFNIWPATIIRWKNEVYIVKEEYFIKLKELGVLP